MKRLIAVLFAMFTLVGVASAAPPYPYKAEPMLSWKRLSADFIVERETLNDESRDTEQEAWRLSVPMDYLLYAPRPGCYGHTISLSSRLSQAFDSDAEPELFIGFKVCLLKSTLY